MNAKHLAPSPSPRHSGIALSRETAVRALVDAVDQVTRDGGLDPHTQAVYVLQNLNLCKDWHWAAYAHLAGTPNPDETTQEAVKAVYLERCKR